MRYQSEFKHFLSTHKLKAGCRGMTNGPGDRPGPFCIQRRESAIVL